MNETTSGTLVELDALLNRNEVAAAQALLESLLKRLSIEELELKRPDIDGLIARFLRKRRRELETVLAERLRPLGHGGEPAKRDAASGLQVPGTENAAATSDSGRTADYVRRLNLLRDRHIFRWNLEYRETVGFIFKDLLALTGASESSHQALAAASSAFQVHSAEIFSRGFAYVTSSFTGATDVATAKSLSGLQRFLFVVIDLYSSSAVGLADKEAAIRLRAVCSAMLKGILVGYGQVSFAPALGWELLEKYPLQWAHALPFFTGKDLDDVVALAPETELFSAAGTLVRPTLLAIDRTMQTGPFAGVSIPRAGRYWTDPARLELVLAPTLRTQQAGLRCVVVLAPPESASHLVPEALAGGASLVVARTLGRDTQDTDESWDFRVVDAAPGQKEDAEHSVAERVQAILQRATSGAAVGGGNQTEALTHNPAANFPLGDKNLRQFYLVQRQSVRSLLDTFSQGTGAHVWCSVRRSGKTTSTIELAGQTDRTTVIVQTMDHEPNYPELNLFRTRIVAALEAGKALPADFFEGVVRECAIGSAQTALLDGKKVLILDEYETLFGLMNSKAIKDDWVRHAVVQPLLSQMVGFSSRHLLIFLGQRPDAHFILMSQNQLSPLVSQRSFPLFDHAERGTSSEFAEFVAKVMSPAIPFAPAFVDAVFAETSGHPYLTVNLLIDLCSWLVETNRPVANLKLTADDFEAFSVARLAPAVLKRSAYYTVFQQMISGALSEATREREPWLYAVTSVVQQIGGLKKLSCPEPRFIEFASAVAPLAHTSPEQLLQSASMANFLAKRDGQIRPSIRLFGRLAGVASGKVN